MSKSNPSEVKLAVPTSGGFSGLKSLNLQVFVMIGSYHRNHAVLYLDHRWCLLKRP
ncbi:xylose transport system permease XylH [Escherichia coli]|nr:xylose transport system permease XylH [Escherichia coli]